jgi:hypothetical protein
MCLVVASITPALEKELRALGGRLGERRSGYAEVVLGPWQLMVAVVDEVAQAERDQLLGAFGHGELVRLRDRIWWQRETGRAMPSLKELPGQDRVLKKLLAAIPPKQRLAGIAPEQRVAGLDPKQRLAGLNPEELVSGLTDENVPAVLEALLRRLPQRSTQVRAKQPSRRSPRRAPSRRH